MKIILTIFFIIFTYTSLQAQNDKPIYITISNIFERHYNNQQYDSIYALFAPEMKNALPLDKTNEFLTGLMSQAGKIKTREFTGFKNTYATFKTVFENMTLSLQISINDDGQINGMFVRPYIPDNIPVIERTKSKMILPFNEAWYVVWGGDTKEQNYHVESNAQKNAFDWVIMDKDGKTFTNDGKKNEDYYAFGKELIAPCDGVVVLAVDGIKDNVPGEMNTFHAGGNCVIIKTANNEFIVIAHFKQNSIKVKEGESVKQGQLLGLCGNSGHSSEAHVHFHVQNVEDMNTATGVKCYFEKITVNGSVKTDYSPLQGEVIKNY